MPRQASNRRMPPRALRARGRYLQRRLRRSRMPRVGGVLQPVQYFKRSTYQTNWVLNDTINNTFKSLEFYLSSVPNHTEFTSLYDQYCIKKVVFTLIPKFNVNTLTDIVPPVWSVLDYDGTFPTNQDGMLQYQNLHTTRGQTWHKRVLTPAILTNQYNGLTTAYTPKKGQFIDCQNDSVPHYGARIMLLPGVTGGSETPFAYDLKTTYYLAFKNVR